MSQREASHEPTEEEYAALAKSLVREKETARDALTAVNRIRDRRIRNEALEEAAQFAEQFSATKHVAFDMAAGTFPLQTPMNNAIAMSIRALKDKEPVNE